MSETTKTKKDNRVEIFVPRGRSNEDPNMFISVNGVNYLIPPGKKSLVPDFVAYEYERDMAAESALYERKTQMIEQGQEPIVQR
jgi:hypothetical protein